MEQSFFEMLTVAHLVYKCHVFCRAWKFITAFTRARH